MEQIRGTEVARFLSETVWADRASSTSRTTGDAPSDRRARTGDHIDVWNGYRSSAKWLMEWFSWLGYYSNYAEAKEIWFWEVK